jgi:imidazolonepropionase-like amidohydrolase
MNATVLICGSMFDGLAEKLTGPTEILVQDDRISSIGRSVERPPGVQIIDLSARTVSPGFIDTHVHLTMDASNLAKQTLESSASKALKGLNLAREYMSYGFTTLRDLGSADPEWPTVDLRNAIAIEEPPWLFSESASPLSSAYATPRAPQWLNIQTIQSNAAATSGIFTERIPALR